jgi:hypothetical protein
MENHIVHHVISNPSYANQKYKKVYYRQKTVKNQDYLVYLQRGRKLKP